MSSKKEQAAPVINMRHRGRPAQVPLYFGKFLRIFIYQNDWKVLPMAAIIAGMVSLVIRNGYCKTMEGTLLGALALSCVAIWNGSFNSIQVICRERSIVKREHRAGMHISAYIIAHTLFQAIICVAQTVVTLYVCSIGDVKFLDKGVYTNQGVVELGVTLFLITFAADMISLFVSALVHNTTTAMTVMPFLLIFQLVFSGGVFNIPERFAFLQNFTLSHYGLECIAAQADYNNLPMASGWNTLIQMKNLEIDEEVTLDQVLNFIQNNKSEPAAKMRSSKIFDNLTVEELITDIQNSSNYPEIADDTFNIRFTVQDVLDMAGEEKSKEVITTKSAEACQREEFALTKDNITYNWVCLLAFAAVFFILTMVILKPIDKDKR